MINHNDSYGVPESESGRNKNTKRKRIIKYELVSKWNTNEIQEREIK